MSNKNGRSDLRSSARDEEIRPQTNWTPPALLDAPQARPGFKQRWVATTILGKETPDNVYKRMREGWEPRDAKTVSKDFPVATIEHGKLAVYIGVEGMVLGEMPEEMVAERNEYYAKKTRNQELAVSNDLHRVEQQGNPIQREHRSKTTYDGE